MALVLRIEQLRLRQDFFLREQVCINTEIFGIVNAVGFLLKPELAKVSVYIREFGDGGWRGGGGGGGVNDVTIYLKEVIRTLI